MKSPRIGLAFAGAALLVGLVASPATAQDGEALMMTASGSGLAEVPAGSGQPEATVAGAFTLTPSNQLTYTTSVQGATEEPAGAHIHRGAAGTNGDVVVELDPAAVAEGREATVDVPAEVADQIRQNPSGFYFNVHSASFPDGLARAQLTRQTDPAAAGTGEGGGVGGDGGDATGGAVGGGGAAADASKADGAEAPSMIDTGTGGQAAEQGGPGALGTVAVGAVALLGAAAGGVLVRRRLQS